MGEDTPGAAPCEEEEESLVEVEVGGSNQGVVEEANEEGRRVWEGAWRCQSAVKSQRWVEVKMRGLLFVKAWQPVMMKVKILK